MRNGEGAHPHMTFLDTFRQLDPESRRLVQVLAVINRPATARSLSAILRPFTFIDLFTVESRLQRMISDFPGLILHHDTGGYQLAPEHREAALDTFPLGDPLDRYEAGEPMFTRYGLFHLVAEHYRGRRKPPSMWHSLDDLAAQLTEFDMRCAGEDYDAAAQILTEISFNYLLRWGHHRLVVDLRERLVDRIENPVLAQGNLGELGSAYAYLGEMDKAIACQEKALRIARENGDRANEGVWLTNLGNRYVNLGQTQKAIPYYEQSLIIARERGDRRSEALNIVSLGTCFAYLGHYDEALTLYDNGQTIARELGDLGMEGFCLSNLGNIYAALGQVTRAIASHDQALEIARQMESRVEESRRLGSLADALIIGGHYGEALDNLRQGLTIDAETGSARGKNFKGCSLARLYLFTGDLSKAREAIEVAREYDTPQNNYNVNALYGLIALRQGERETAIRAFEDAIAQARTALSYNATNYDAHAAQGLAFSGLVVLGVGPRAATLEAAQAAYRQARASSQGAGLAMLSLRLFDVLAETDPDHLLAPVRPLIGG